MYEREVWVWVFFMPLVFFYFIGTVTGGAGGSSPGGKDRIAVRVPDDAGFLFDQIQRRLEENDLEVVKAEDSETFNAYTRRLTIPDRFTERVLAGEQVKLKFQRRKSGMGNDFDQLRVSRAVYTTLADVVVSADAGGDVTPESLARLNQMKPTLTLIVEAAGKRREIPSGYEQTIPGTMVMFVLLNVLSNGAITLVTDRKKGLLRRLASTPIARRDVFVGKWMSRMMLGLIQIAVGIVAGTVLFGMDWGSMLPMVFVVLAAWAALCASLGIVIGSLGQTEGQVAGLSVLCSLVLAALGGCWWPIEITPEWMQTLQLFLPTGWAMDAMHKLISFQLGATSVLPHITAMLATALGLGWFGTRVFRFT
jgi:ABC-type multidrug transport system permease subunit